MTRRRERKKENVGDGLLKKKTEFAKMFLIKVIENIGHRSEK